ncbi:MAG: SdrD B-like domain-containing protein [Bacteroidota bacterium]
MKQLLPFQSSNSDASQPGLQIRQSKHRNKFRAATQNRYFKGAIYGLIMCSMGFYLFQKKDLIYKNAQHQIEGTLYMDADGNQLRGENEQSLPFVKLNLYTDINDNQYLDEQDLQLATCLTDAQGNYSFNIAHGRTLIARVRDPKHEKQVNTVSGSIKVGQSYISLGGDGGVSNLTSLTFDKIELPSDAKIQHAFLRFRAATHNHERPIFWLFGEKSPQKETDAETYTRQSVLWECGSWKKDHLYQSPDLSKIVSSLLQAGSQSISIIVEGNEGFKEAYSSADHAPQLVVQYQIPDHAYLLSVDPSYSSAHGADRSFSLAFKDHQDVSLAYPGTPPTCLALTKDGRMASLNWYSGMYHAFPPAERPSIEAEQLSWSQSQVYGLFKGQIGRISVPQGGFQKLRLKHKTDLVALSAQPSSKNLWAIDQKGFVLLADPEQEQWIEHPISLVAYTELQDQEIVQLAYVDISQKLYALIKSPQGKPELWCINTLDASIKSLGELWVHGRPIKEVLNLSAQASGKLLLITGQDNLPELSNLIVEFNPQNMQSNILKPFANRLQMKQCACLLAAPHQIEGQVFFDRNANGRQDQTELAYPNIKLHLYLDQNQNERLDPQDWLLQTLFTDSQGKYYWQDFHSAQYLIQLDTTTLPEGIALMGSPIQKADFRDFIGGGVYNSLHFSANQSTRISQIHWARFQAQALEKEVKLSWVTTQEEESGHYYVLRSEDGINYENIGRLVARGPSKGMQEYEYHDQDFSQLQSGSAIYRLRWENVQGQSSYSDIRSLVQENDGLRLELSQNGNRPLDLRYRTDNSGKAALEVINLAGQTVFQKSLITGPDWRQLKISNHDWSPGIYYIQWDDQVQSRLKKIVIQ